MKSEEMELSKDMKDLLRNINECLIDEIKNKKLETKLTKLDFLEKEGFYEKYEEKYFE